MLNIKKTKIMDTNKCVSKTVIEIGEDTIDLPFHTSRPELRLVAAQSDNNQFQFD